MVFLSMADGRIKQPLWKTDIDIRFFPPKSDPPPAEFLYFSPIDTPVILSGGAQHQDGAGLRRAAVVKALDIRFLFGYP